MSQHPGSVDVTEEVKIDVLGVFSETTTENIVVATGDKVEEPREDPAEIRKAFQLRIVNTRGRLVAAMQDPVYPKVAVDTKLAATMTTSEYEVTRYLSGLNLKVDTKPKEVRAYFATKKKVEENLVKYEKVATDTEALFVNAIKNKKDEIKLRETKLNEDVLLIKESTDLDNKLTLVGRMKTKDLKGNALEICNNPEGNRKFFSEVLTSVARSDKEKDAARLALADIAKFDQLQNEIKSVQGKIATVQSEYNLDVKRLETERDGLKRDQVVEWSNPSDIVYGTPLGPTQLNAKLIKGDGQLKYENSKGWVIKDEVLSVGSHPLTVTALSSDLFKASAPVTVTIKVTPATLEIHCKDVTAPLIYGAPLTAQHLAATVTTDPPRPDAYAELAKSLTYTESGKKVTGGSVLNAGERTIEVHLPSDKNFLPPTPKAFKIKVEKATQVLTWTAPTPLKFVYGAPLTIGQLNATLTSNSPAAKWYDVASPIVYTDAANNPVSIGKWLNAGKHTIVANAVGNTNFLAADPQSAVFEVEPAEREITASALKPIEAVLTKFDMEQLARRIKLNKDKQDLEFWIDGTKLAVGVALKCGDGRIVKATAIPNSNYKPTEAKEVSVDVIRRKPVIDWKEPTPLQADEVNGVNLPATLFNAKVKLGDQTLIYSHSDKDKVRSNAGTEPKILFLTATHPESEEFERGTKTVRLLVVNNAEAGKGYEDMVDGKAFDTNSLTTAQKDLYNNFAADKDGVKTATTELIGQIQDLTGPEMEELLNELVPADRRDDERLTKSWKEHPNVLYALPNGMQVRYKPLGDEFNPNPMFCIEGRTSTGTSNTLDDVAFKITLDGVATAKGPSQNKALTGRPYANSQYIKGTCMSTHFQCAPKVEHPVEWQVPKDLAFSATSSETWAKLPRDAGAATWEWPANMTGNRFAVGDGQTVKLTLAGTNKYKQTVAQTNFDVKPARQVISFEKGLEIEYGSKFDPALLKVALNVEPVAAGEVVSGTVAELQKALKILDEKNEAADGKIFDAPQAELKIVAPATGNFSETTEPVSVRIKPCAMTIQWNIDDVVEIEEGTELSMALLSATVVTAPPHEAEYTRLREGLTYVDLEGKEVRSGTILPIGDHRITVRSVGEVNFSAPEAVHKTISVKEKTKL